MPNSVVSKTIIKKTTCNVTVSSVDEGEELAEKTSPFDNYIQLIGGAAELTINKKEYLLKLGEGIIIPTHTGIALMPMSNLRCCPLLLEAATEVKRFSTVLL